MDGMAVDLAKRGIATWNVEYRRSPNGWHHALSDIATALDHLTNLAGEFPVDVDRVAVAGHSAGAQLALWAAGRARLAADSPWAAPVVSPRLAVTLAGVVDLNQAADDHLGDDAVEEFFGGRPAANISPSDSLPVGVPLLVAHGTADDQVPVEYSRGFVTRARAAGDAVQYLEFDEADHFVFTDQDSAEWDSIATRAIELLGGS